MADHIDWKKLRTVSLAEKKNILSMHVEREIQKPLLSPIILDAHICQKSSGLHRCYLLLTDMLKCVGICVCMFV